MQISNMLCCQPKTQDAQCDDPDSLNNGTITATSTAMHLGMTLQKNAVLGASKKASK
jgi:hypothetical protein